MGGFQLPAPSDYGQLDPYAIYGYNGYGGMAPYSPGIATASQDFGSALGQSGPDVNPNASMEDIFAANRNEINNTGNMIGREAGQQLNYYAPIQQQYQAAQNQALNQLQQTPGFTPQEASQINVNYGQFNTTPDQYSNIAGNPNAPVDTLQSGLAGEGAMLNAYQANLGGQLGQYGTNLGGAVGRYGTGVSGAVGGLGSGLTAAQGKFGALDTAVGNPALGFDPNSTEKQMTDTDVQNMRTAAGTTVGNQFRTAEDTLQRQAAAAGNTSPAALAAMRQQLVTQEASSAGDAEVQADIAARQAQFQRAQQIEAQRLGATQQQAGMQATAATTEEAAAQAAAGQAGLAGISAAENVGQAGIGAAENLGQANLNAANQYGQFSTNQLNTMTGQQYGAQATAEQLAAQRAQQIAGMQYGQGVGSQQLTSQGAQTIGGARMAGQGAYRSGVAQQQGMAQQGGQQAINQQLGAYGTQTAGLNQTATGQAGFETGKASLGDTAGRGLVGLFSGHADGAIVTEPEIAKLGERGPEVVIPLDGIPKPPKVPGIGRYRGTNFRSGAMTPKMFGKAA